MLDGRCDGPTVEVAALLTSELVTNAVLHGAPPVQLRIDITETAIRVEVYDTSIDTPELKAARSTDRHGRGLAIVAALATRWGSERTRDGKLVWFERTY